jgi:hypothetical protein
VRTSGALQMPFVIRAFVMVEYVIVVKLFVHGSLSRRLA